MYKLLINSLLCLLFLCTYFTGNSQVGINTLNPQETLHVNGTVRVTETTSNKPNSDKLVGFDNNKTINEIDVGHNLTLNNGRLDANFSFYYLTTIDVPTTNNFILLTEALTQLNTLNKDTTVFNINPTGTNGQVKLSGIEGGTHGKHIFIYMRSSKELVIDTENVVSAGDGNSVYDQASGSLNINQHGMLELVYDGTINRWFILGYRQ